MDQQEKMRMLFEILNASNSEIAKRGGVDPSLVCRYRSGSRLPSRNSKNFLKFCSGIISYAIDKNLWSKLKKLCNLADDKSPEEALVDFLFATDNGSSHNMDKELHSKMSFGERLKLLLDMLDVSNVMFAKALNVDTSLISRLKNGDRIPKKDSDLIKQMCSYFIKKLKTANHSYDTLKLFNIPTDILTEGEDEASIIKLSQWLLVNSSSNTLHSFDRFIKKMDQDKIPKLDVTNPPFSTLPPQPNDSQLFKKFNGMDGFRSALIILLSKVASTKKSHTIKIFSDQSLEWILSADPYTAQVLTSIFYYLLENNCNVKVIHNTNRGPDEMLAGLEQWFSFYRTGSIEGYYCSSPTGNIFSHTIITVKDVASIFATNVTKTEEHGIFYYSELSEDSKYYDAQFDALLKHSSPLAQVYNRNSISKYLYLHSKLSHNKCELKDFSATPSVHTMPLQLFSKIIKRVAEQYLIDPDETIEQYKYLQKRFNNDLTNSTVIEYIYFPPLEEIKNGMLPIDLSDLLIEGSLPYQYSEYIEHISHLISLLSNENYHIVPLSSAPLGNNRIITRNPGSASIFFNFSSILHIHHLRISKTLDEYINLTSINYRLPLQSKNEIIKFLKSYIQ